MFSQIPKMSSAIDFTLKNLPGFKSPEGRCLPCSGLSGRTVTSHGEYQQFSKVKILNLKSPYKSTSYMCSASSFSNHKRNPDFSRQNKHGFSRGRNRQNEDRDGYENIEESEMLSSRNGPLLTTSNTSKFQATATPGPREKEIVELFRKVQAQLREKAAIKEEKKSEELQGKGKESETVDSLLKLLRKHSVQKGKKTSSSRSSNFVLDQPDKSNVFSEERASNLTELNSNVNHVAQESGTPFVNRPKSNFQRRSPVPRIKFQPIYHEGGTDNPVASSATGKMEKDIHLDLELGQIPRSKVDSDPEPIFSDKHVFDEMAGDNTAKMYGSVDASDDEEHNHVGHDELAEMKLTELRAIAKSRSLRGYSKLKKLELIELLSADQV
ncbi:rho-N domain-containing protein 1, chloroplastic isoform X1 [Solanum pennellii]|uniref:Rho-N domain-containing protein 1, chloroplastic isoform X1 n=1 Tax=Solanum pennellii TaxID=28526 RepID=A0ABM1HQ43_SOLPN|nr:rho-N domain-containing protein 1, chloroplastic isoform X1 [Solanum pennellii]